MTLNLKPTKAVIRCVFVLVWFGGQSATSAALAQTSGALDIALATQRLNAELLNRQNQLENTPEKVRSLTRQSLNASALSLAPDLDGVLSALVPLSEQVEACLPGCPQAETIRLTLNRKVNRDAGTAVVLLPNADQNVQIFLFDHLVAVHCTAKPTQRCHNATELAINLWRIAGGFRALSKTLSAADIASSKTQLNNLDQQWLSYKDDTIKLWPHETLLSSIAFRQNQSGFSAPPNYKILALRPSLGLSYFSNGSPDFRPSINVDLFGVYWWKYRGTNAEPGRGLSASLIWGGDDTAVGLTYHHGPRWSATLARSDDNDVVVSVSLQLAHLLFK